MPARTFQPGFRLSALDVFVLLARGPASGYAVNVEQWFGIAIAFVALHFFLFCNVLRMARRLELIWAGFCCASAVRASVGVVSGRAVFIAASVMTVCVVFVQLRRPSYHGVGWRQVNPRLLEWWMHPPPAACSRQTTTSCQG